MRTLSFHPFSSMLDDLISYHVMARQHSKGFGKLVADYPSIPLVHSFIHLFARLFSQYIPTELGIDRGRQLKYTENRMTGKYFQSKNHAMNGQILLQWMKNVRHIFPIKKSCQKAMDRFDPNGPQCSLFFFSAIFLK